jgi:pyridoxal phosphate enzyme (YggS family)
MSLRERILQNLLEVRERMAIACQRAGRQRHDVTLVAVTKTMPPEIAEILIDLGVRDLGESRPQELWRKAMLCPDAHWQLIGHLQRNKVERTIPMTTLIHSVDSIRLLQSIDEVSRLRRTTTQVLLEVNASGEPAKHGFRLDQLSAISDDLIRFSNVKIMGLMTMAAIADDPDEARPAFRALRRLRDAVRTKWGDPASLPHLSMGMTGDFEVAIEEGATMVRIGSALFEGCRDPILTSHGIRG